MFDVEKIKLAEAMEISYFPCMITGNEIKKFREDNGLSLVALSNILRVRKREIEIWENGKKSPKGPARVLIKLLKDNPELLKQLYVVKDYPLSSQHKKRCSE